MASELEDVRGELVTELKEAYKGLYENVQTVQHLLGPSTGDKPVFVEGGIEMLAKRTENVERWVSLQTYTDIRTDPRIKSDRIIIEGGPVSGKSVLTLKLAYDWSLSESGSFLNDVDIVIVLKCEQLASAMSIYDCIKQFLLPKASNVTVGNIKEILGNTLSVLLVLDDVEEYNEHDSKIKRDILAIMRKELFPRFEVILMTRSQHISKKYLKETKRIRLTGFDRLAQDKYLRKVVTNDDDDSGADIIKESLQDNPMLSDLCRVPFFFIIYAHISLENDRINRYTTITSYFRKMISCLHDHFKGKMNDCNPKKVLQFEPDHEKLNKVAYERITGYAGESWSRDYLSKALGETFYEQYLRIGIFVELFDKKDDVLAREKIRRVSFNHELICEWFAAHYVVDAVAPHGSDLDKLGDEMLLDLLEDLYPSDYQHLYRFVCGIYPNLAKHIIHYIRGMEGCKEYTILCMLEQSGSNELVSDSIRDFCAKPIHLANVDSKLLHRSTLQILAMASHNQLAISSLTLHEAIQSVDISTNEILLTSGHRLPIQNTLKQLWIEMTGHEWSEDILSKLFVFASNCEALRSVSFSLSVMPRLFLDLSTLSKLHEKSIEVMWYPTLLYFRLNLQSGYWEHISSGFQITIEEYEKEISLAYFKTETFA